MKKKILLSTAIVTAMTLGSSFLSVPPVSAADNFELNEANLSNTDSDALFNYIYSNQNSDLEKVKDSTGNEITSINLELDAEDISSSNLSSTTKSLLKSASTNEESNNQEIIKSKTLVSVLINQSESKVKEDRSNLLSSNSISAAALGSGSLTDQAKKDSYGTVIGTINYVTSVKNNITYYGIKSISGKFFPIGDSIVTKRFMNAGQVGPNANKVANFTPTTNEKTTYNLNWTADSLLVPQGASVVGMNIELTVKKGIAGSPVTINKSVTVINY